MIQLILFNREPPRGAMLSLEATQHIRRHIKPRRFAVVEAAAPPSGRQRRSTGRQFPVLAKNSLFWQKDSLLSEEQGIGCKPLNQLGDRLPKPPKEAGIVRNFQAFPVNFPVFRETAMVRSEPLSCGEPKTIRVRVRPAVASKRRLATEPAASGGRRERPDDRS